MSKTDPACYPTVDPLHYRGSKSDRSPSLHEMVESWNRLETFDFRAETTAKRAEKRKQKEMHHARLDHEINHLLNACAPFPATENE